MPNSTTVNRAKVRLKLTIDGVGDFEVTLFNATFGISAIPSASCTLAVGRNALTPSKIAAINAKAGQLSSMVRSRVYLTMQGAYGRGKSWPTTPTVVFDGYLTGIGNRKLHGNIVYVAHLIHWVSDMSFSSTLSQQSHPTNPSDYTYDAIYTSLGGGSRRPQGIGILLADEVINQDSVGDDLWGAAIKPFFCSLSQTDRIKTTDDLAGITAEDKTNSLALAALKRFQGGQGLSDCGAALTKFVPKLSLDIQKSTIAGRIAATIAKTIANASIESYAYTTLWDMLVADLGPRFMFATVPLVDTVAVVPMMPGLRALYSQQVLAEEYDFVDLSAYTPRPLQGVGIYGAREFKAGSRDPNDVQRTSIGGFFQPTPAPRGMFLFRAAPTWLAEIGSSYTSPSRTSGIGGKRVANTSTTIVSGDQELIGGDDQKTQAQAASEAEDYYNRYAQSVYTIEALRGRNGMLAGKLRFDIAPGSNILIEGSSEQFLGSGDLLGQNLVATVMRVSIGISADPPRTGTGFQLGHVRTTQENQRDATSISRHPLYTTTYTGSPLVANYLL